jgi:hypothetical protein
VTRNDGIDNRATIVPLKAPISAATARPNPDLARDPKSEEEFWAIIEETFTQIEGALTDYPVETREEALAGTLRGGKFKNTSVSIIRHRGVDNDIDSRDYFLEMGRKFLPKVKQQIEARVLTPKFAKDWGVVMMCHGFISSHILDDTDGLFHARAGQSGNRDAERKYFAHLLLHWMGKGHKRKAAATWQGSATEPLKPARKRGVPRPIKRPPTSSLPFERYGRPARRR